MILINATQLKPYTKVPTVRATFDLPISVHAMHAVA
jgi:hypothetical protein